ncbi:type VI secretion system ImpA family N-terminal domain-containing protein (plasmid) [Paracoccus sp. TK19116]|uniref:Type VI secretion system ImpA family N-terminal domain-containing protein n=1 Tax=Paracoccus albicereus TaxID=2922394 RepID=A0ABT1MLK3_9RHOB|nr:type VI secretion system ImpA family N-terminal domain-containing protein [Paracoccus albicereus]MCQ0969178.1 type VI secretion system ImpA family N-terminal domain-containing protein [Paracoccus albicereus]
MTLDWILDPLPDAPPCGPDLAANDDPAFADYYYEAEARLPERYVIPGMAGVEGSIDRVFDPKSINLSAETQAITALLRRSRDLRLLSLLARFQILAARPADFADTLVVVAALMRAHGASVHPTPASALSDRRAALDALGSVTAIIMPLQHLALNGRADATWRRMMIAQGQAQPRAGEEVPDRDAVLSALSGAAHRASIERTHAALSQAADALADIAQLSGSEEGGRIRPAFQDTQVTLAAMLDLIAKAQPDLSRATVSQPAAIETDQDQPEPATSATGAGALPAVSIADRAAVRAALTAAERWLARNEPSSPALLLVTQARLLVGRPLIEALEVLMPGEAGRAVISFGRETGFSLPMDRLRALSQSVEGGFEEPPVEDVSAPLSQPTDRSQLAAILLGVESFYQRVEPASPIPILLARARGLMDKGFQAIVAELIPRPTSE